ncbi:dolichyl-P-Man:Man5GlcNAc2-PP-dolichol alpha-1,3-mannosyltransferase [Malassezia yamatoensis]|uniref:Ubiquinone biosynthesis O-methyltransferase, mitochondrial n=1 Tax=Malassezia yamatoensis TaxID=253288 RepID=A0AAJ6CH26_9BASI|nr:dolichyl-P-Man:Man5GlcNAc2-PP-dolichol alpha-1,3-mannosyltransferase [Malassezia yamatoensis]
MTLLSLLAIPSSPFSRDVYVDENALQPGQVKRAWDWSDVRYADQISDRLQSFVRANDTHGRLAYLCAELQALGLDVHTQSYRYHLPHGEYIEGTNVYARVYTPRIDGREASVLAASWLSRLKLASTPADGLPVMSGESGRAANIRGIALTLALVRRVQMTSYWSKDLIVVLSDGFLDGMQAWASSYFSDSQASLSAEDLHIGGAQIWNGVALDFPGDSYSSLSLLHEGRDAQLPNLDTLNTVVKIIEGLQFQPRIGLHGSTHEQVERHTPNLDNLVAWGFPRRLLQSLESRASRHDAVRRFFAGWRALFAQWRLQLAGHPSGIHGVLLPYHVDALTLFAEPAAGPSGFYDLGGIVELTLRSFSNLHERLHHSQFFYLLLSPQMFVPLGMYLTVPLLLGAALTIAGLTLWNTLGARRDRFRRKLLQRLVPDADQCVVETPTYDDLSRKLASRPLQVRQIALRAHLELGRPVLDAILYVVYAHLIGLACLVIAVHLPRRSLDEQHRGYSRLLPLGLLPVVLSLAGASIARYRQLDLASLGACLHTFALLHAGMVISVLSTLNFGQATTMALLLTLALFPISPPWNGSAQIPTKSSWTSRLCYLIRCFGLVAVMPISILFLVDFAARCFPLALSMQSIAAKVPTVVDLAIQDYFVLRTSALHFVFIGYLPVVIEGLLACSDIAHFSRLSEQWWDEEGEFKPLHRMNQVRIEFMRDKLDEIRGWEAAMDDVLGRPKQTDPAPGSFLSGLTMLDVGCGGGILAESAARLGACVTGADASAENVKVATLHAEQDPGLHLRKDAQTFEEHSVSYVATPAEKLRDNQQQFDIVTAMEVIEHVKQPAEFLRCLADLVKPGGYLFMSTMSRTVLSYFLTIFMAERVLRVVSEGTHRHAQYINPNEMVDFFKNFGWIQEESAKPQGRALLPDGAPVAPMPLRLQYETRGTMFLPIVDKWVLAPQSVADEAATAKPITSFLPALLGGTQRCTEQCNYFFYVRKPI